MCSYWMACVATYLLLYLKVNDELECIIPKQMARIKVISGSKIVGHATLTSTLQNDVTVGKKQSLKHKQYIQHNSSQQHLKQ